MKKKKKPAAPKPPAAPKEPAKRVGSITRCAFEMNLTKARVQMLAIEGMPKPDKRGVYHIDECLRWYVRYLQAKMKQKSVMDAEGNLTTSAGARHQLLKIDMELKALELAEKREDVVTIEHARKELEGIVLEVKTRILALPPRLAASVLGETDLAVSQVKVDKALRGALEGLAKYETSSKTGRA